MILKKLYILTKMYRYQLDNIFGEVISAFCSEPLAKEITASWKKRREINDLLKKEPKTVKAVCKPSNMYIKFCQDNRDLVKSQNPTMTSMEITKELSKRWKNIDKKLKSEYKAVYEQEMKEYKEKTEKPKKFPSSFVVFCNEKRKNISVENPKLKPTEITIKLTEIWNTLSKEEKEKYKSIVDLEKIKFKKTLRKARENFELEELEETPNITAEELSKKWQELSEKDKLSFF